MIRFAIVVIGFCSALAAPAEGYKLEDAYKVKPKNVTINIQVNGGQPQAPSQVVFYNCTVRAFGKSYDANGNNETLAKFNARKKCEADNSEMFCRDVKCEGGVEAAATWICRVKPFTESYEAIGGSQVEAKFKVKQLCMAENHEMHCDSIKCEQ